MHGNCMRSPRAQAQLEEAERERGRAETRRKRKQAELQALERCVLDAERDAAELRDAAARARTESNDDAERLRLIQARVTRGELSADAAIAEVQQALDQLPDAAGARGRLLGLQMGVAASASEVAEASSSDGGVSREWLPREGETVLVRARIIGVSASASARSAIARAVSAARPGFGAQGSRQVVPPPRAGAQAGRC